jgi:hypothetical protein
VTHKAVVWTILLSFLAALVPPPAAAGLTPEQYFVIAERIAGLEPARQEQVLQGMSAAAQVVVRKILAEQFTPTHVVLHPQLQVEVDVGDRGRIDAVRIWFTARDPALPPEPATLALRPRAEVEEPLGAFTTAAVNPACGGPPPSPLEQFRQLTPDELKELERRFHIPLTATGATQAGQQALILSGIRAAHLGSHLVQAAVAAFGAGAVAGATVVFRTGLIGPLEFAVGSLAARTFVVVVGGVGGSLIGLGALAVVLAFEIGRRHWAKAEPTVALATPEECAPPPDPGVCEIEDPGTWSDLSFLGDGQPPWNPFAGNQTEIALAQLGQHEGPPAGTTPEGGQIGCGRWFCARDLNNLRVLPCTWEYRITYPQAFCGLPPELGIPCETLCCAAAFPPPPVEGSPCECTTLLPAVLLPQGE